MIVSGVIRLRLPRWTVSAMTEHILKVEAPYFEALASGEKTFEVRRNDRSFQRGDRLVLLDTGKCTCVSLDCDRRPAPLHAEVTYVYAGDPRFGGHGGLQPGYVVLGIRPLLR